MLATALAARRTGKDSWIRLQNAARIPLTMLQAPDGSFQPIEGIEPIAGPENNADWQAAHLAMALGADKVQFGEMKGSEGKKKEDK